MIALAAMMAALAFAPAEAARKPSKAKSGKTVSAKKSSKTKSTAKKAAAATAVAATTVAAAAALPVVTVVASDPVASEVGLDPARVTFARTGPTDQPLCTAPTPITLAVGEARLIDPLGETSCLGLTGDAALRAVTAEQVREVARFCPMDRMLIETDAPFLAPVPHRGKTCEPAFVRNTAEFVAELRGESLEQLAETTSANFHRLFRKTA